MPQVFIAFFAKIGITGLVGTVLGYVAYTLVTVALLRALTPKANMSQMRGLMANTRGATDPQQLVYGTVRKGGTITYLESTGDTNEYLHMILVLAGHEVNAIGDIYINDEVATLDANGFVTSQNWNSKIRIKKHLGTSTQTVDAALLAESAQIDSNFRGRGIAYLYIRLQYDQDVFPNGIPLFSAVVQGKKVFDPRTSTTAYSANAALCIRDYLTDSRGLEDSNIDDTSFSAAANVCDENVALDAGGTEKRYTINGVLNADMSIQDCLQQMVTACGGSLWWGGGSWKLKPGYYTAPVKTLTLDDIVSEINVQTRIAMRDNFNIVRGTFNDAGQRWIAAEYPEFYSAAFVAEDDGVESPIDLELPLTTSSATAQRLAKQLLFRNREQLTFTADFGMEALQLQVGDIIALTIDRYGWSAKEFEVVGWTFGANGEAGDLRVTMTLRETSSSAFSWSAEESAITSNNSNLPDPFGGLTVTGLTASGGGRVQGDGTFINSAILDWNDVSNTFVDYYEVEWRAAADSSYAATTTDESGIELSPLIDGISYIFRVRAVTIAGVRGPWATVTFTGGGDTTAPGLPTGLSALGAFKYITVSWTNPADADLSHVEIYENTTNNSASAALAGISAGTNFVRSGLGLAVTRYYWLKSVDFSGNKSAFTAGVSATTTYLDDPDFEGGIRTLFQDAGLSAPEIVSSLPSTGNFQGRLVFLTTDNKLYRWTGSAWTAAVPTVDLTGTISEAQIAANAVTVTKIADAAVAAAKIATNAVTTDKINALAVNADKIAANAVTVAKIADAAVEAGKIASNAVTTDKINALAVNADKIAANAVTVAKIADAAVEAGKIASNAVTTDKINALAITEDKVAAAAITTNKIATGAVQEANLATAAATEAKIATNAITETKISSNAVTSAKISAGAVIAGKIAAGAVQAGNIAAGAIVAGDIAASTITGDKIAANTLTASNIQAGTITADEIAANTITGAKIAADTIESANIKAGTIQAADIAASTITGDKIATNTLTASNIQAGTITADEIAANTITGAKIAADTIESANIKTGTIQAADIASGTITGDKIATNTLTASNIQAGTITADEIAANTITGAKIAAETIESANIKTGTIQAADIASGTITGDKIAANTLTAGNILSGTITATQIASETITASNIAGNTITGDKIVANTITGGLLAASGIITSTAQINDALITNAKISDLSADKINAGTITAGRLIGSGAVRISRGSYNATITISDTITSSDFSVSLTGVTSGNIIVILGWARMQYGITTYVQINRSGITGTTGYSTQLQAPAGTSDADAWVLGGTASSSTVSADFTVIPAGSGSTTVTYDLEIIILEFYK